MDSITQFFNDMPYVSLLIFWASLVLFLVYYGGSRCFYSGFMRSVILDSGDSFYGRFRDCVPFAASHDDSKFSD